MVEVAGALLTSNGQDVVIRGRRYALRVHANCDRLEDRVGAAMSMTQHPVIATIGHIRCRASGVMATCVGMPSSLNVLTAWVAVLITLRALE